MATSRRNDSFRDLAPAVKPLPDKAARVPQPEPAGAPPPREETAGPRLPPLVVERGNEWARGAAEGLDRRRLVRLGRGEPRPTASIDVHGRVAADARREVSRFVRQAREQGRQSVLVIFGRGLHSGPRGPVLRDEMIALLGESLTDHVLAFCSAPGELGGSGAFVVLLRRARRKPSKDPEM